VARKGGGRWRTVVYVVVDGVVYVVASGLVGSCGASRDLWARVAGLWPILKLT
jgi:hypothetical protein